jgi:ATP synthase protein I
LGVVDRQPVHGAAIARPAVHRITVIQVIVLVVVCGVLRPLDPVLALSMAAGGLIAIVPQAYFALRVFSRRGARSARHIARASYAGEIGKFVLAVAGFGLVFALLRPIEGWAVFAGYGGMLIIQVTGAWLLMK